MKQLPAVVEGLSEEKVQELRELGLGYGQIAHIFILAEKSGKTVDQVAALFTGEESKGFGEVAKELGLHPSMLAKGKKQKNEESLSDDESEEMTETDGEEELVDKETTESAEELDTEVETTEDTGVIVSAPNGKNEEAAKEEKEAAKKAAKDQKEQAKQEVERQREEMKKEKEEAKKEEEHKREEAKKAEDRKRKEEKKKEDRDEEDEHEDEEDKNHHDDEDEDDEDEKEDDEYGEGNKRTWFFYCLFCMTKIILD